MKNKLVLIPLFALLTVALMGASVERYFKCSYFTLGGGTTLTKALVGSGTFPDASTTTGTMTVTGLLPGDVVTATPISAYSGSAYLKSAVPTTNTLTLTWSADPGTTVTLGYHAFHVYQP
jgi:hypothetical protein